MADTFPQDGINNPSPVAVPQQPAAWNYTLDNSIEDVTVSKAYFPGIVTLPGLPGNILEPQGAVLIDEDGNLFIGPTGGGGGCCFPSTEDIMTSSEAPITAGNKNIHYITTDGSGTTQQINLPQPPDDGTGTDNSSFWYSQWCVFVIKTQTNVNDVVLINASGEEVEAGFAQPGLDTPPYEAASFTLQGQGETIAFRWVGDAWLLDADSIINGFGSGALINTTFPLILGTVNGNVLSGDGLSVEVIGGDAFTGSNSLGGSISLYAGYGDGTGYAGNVKIKSGRGGTAGNISLYTNIGNYGSGNITLTTANHEHGGGPIELFAGGLSLSGYQDGGILLNGGGPATGGKGGFIVLETGSVDASSTAGGIVIQSGAGADDGAYGGPVVIQSVSTISDSGHSGNIFIQTGPVTPESAGTVGNIVLRTNTDPFLVGHTALYAGYSAIILDGGGEGPIMVFNLPTVDPHNADELWNNGGTVAISAG